MLLHSHIFFIKCYLETLEHIGLGSLGVYQKAVFMSIVVVVNVSFVRFTDFIL